MSGLRPCVWTALRCREPSFQRFLGVDSDAAAAARVRELCEVGSRAELDRDPAAQARWNERIRRAYLKYQNKESADAHHHD
jgi:hypothetical protein